MRSDIVPGAIFPDYELADHTATRRKLSELQGPHPMVLVLSRAAGIVPRIAASLSFSSSFIVSSKSPIADWSQSALTTSRKPANTALELVPIGLSFPIRGVWSRKISANDRLIPTETEKWMAERINARRTITLQTSHASVATHPDEIVSLIEEASSLVST